VASFTFGSGGTVYPCCHYMPLPARAPSPLGIGLALVALATLLLAAGCAAAPPRPAEVVVAQVEARWPPVIARRIETALVRAPAIEAGTVRAIVVDAVDGTPVAGAEVWVEGTTAWSVTDARGQFRLRLVPRPLPGDRFRGWLP
jgi:hypothetical protein